MYATANTIIQLFTIKYAKDGVKLHLMMHLYDKISCVCVNEINGKGCAYVNACVKM